ncbi:MAG: hypothetical protein ACP5E5_12950 [Acidobacteriaceae bacterium]
MNPKNGALHGMDDEGHGLGRLNTCGFYGIAPKRVTYASPKNGDGMQ